MPEKNGLQFLKELREKGNRTSFVLFSGEDKDEIRLEALSFGADGYYTKIGSPETVYGELSMGIELAITRAEQKPKFDKPQMHKTTRKIFEFSH